MAHEEEPYKNKTGNNEWIPTSWQIYKKTQIIKNLVEMFHKG